MITDRDGEQVIIETLREQRTKFQKTSERARKVREDLNDAASDIVATLGEAATLPDDLGTWSKYLIEKQTQIKEERQKQKLEIERARETMDCIDAASFALLDAQRAEWMGHAWKRAAKAMFSCEAAIDNLKLVRE